jgi:hypothetical protein
VAENHADVSVVAVHELFSDPHGPVGLLAAELGETGADLARALCPRDSGRMLGTITHGTDRDPFDFTVRGWFGAGYLDDPPEGTTWQGGFPVVHALQAKYHYVWNRSPRGQKHTRGVRPAHPFLTEAADLLRV